MCPHGDTVSERWDRDVKVLLQSWYSSWAHRLLPRLPEHEEMQPGQDPHPPPLLVLEGESNSQDQSHLWWPGWWNAVEPSELDGEGTDSRAFGG